MELTTKPSWPNDMEFKTRMPWPDPDTGEKIYKWLLDNVGELDVDWTYRKGSDYPLIKMKNLNHSFKRYEDKIKFILKWS